MEYEDEKIIAMRNAEKKKQYNSIESGIYVGDELIKFAECRLFGGRMSIMLPDGFMDMSPEDAKKKYPSENRPQIIKTNADGTVNFTFSLLGHVLSSSQVSQMKEQIKSLIMKAQPANVFYFDNRDQSENRIIEWFDFKSFTIQDPLYNVVFIAEIDNKTLLGMFNAPFEDWSSWKEVLDKTIITIIDTTKKGA